MRAQREQIIHMYDHSCTGNATVNLREDRPVTEQPGREEIIVPQRRKHGSASRNHTSLSRIGERLQNSLCGGRALQIIACHSNASKWLQRELSTKCAWASQRLPLAVTKRHCDGDTSRRYCQPGLVGAGLVNCLLQRE